MTRRADMHRRQPVLIIIEGRRNVVIAKSKTAACSQLRVSRTKLDRYIDLGKPIDREGRITVDLAM
jgi:hypothetical protein